MKKRKKYRAPDLYVKKLTIKTSILGISASTEKIDKGGSIFDTAGATEDITDEGGIFGSSLTGGTSTLKNGGDLDW